MATWTGTTDADLLVSGNEDDILKGLDGNDQLSGGLGNDTLNGGTGSDKLDGGGGSDTAYFGELVAPVNASLVTGLAVSLDATDVLTGIENLYGTSLNDVLTGDSAQNTIEGDTGNDAISGGAGNDFLHGGKSDDTVDGGSGDDFLEPGEGNDIVSGGAGIDTVSYEHAQREATVDLSLTTAQATGFEGMDTLTGIENLIGSIWNDVLTGSTFDNVLVGGDGDDILSGGGGDDTLVGGTGANHLDGGDGTDTAAFDDLSEGVVVSLEHHSIMMGPDFGTIAGIENLVGSAFSDGLTGDAGANVIDGLAGDDTIDGGGGGSDSLSGGDGDDTVSFAGTRVAVVVTLETSGAQQTGGGGVVTLMGFENLTGGNGSDSLTGDSADNRLTGGPGDDMLYGGPGIDVALYSGHHGNYQTDLVDGIRTIGRAPPFGDGIDILQQVERAEFSDVGLALDFDGNAGLVAIALGAVFGPASIRNSQFVAIGLRLLDDGTSFPALMQMALGARLGANASNKDVVDLLYANLFGFAPDAATEASFVGLLDSGRYSQSSLAVAAAETGQNDANLNLDFWSRIGLAYDLPF